MKQNNYAQTLSEIKEIDRKLRCLDACFSVISQPEMLDSINYQILSLKTKRSMLFKQLCAIKSQTVIL